MRFWLFFAASITGGLFSSALGEVAHASGPVERLTQVLLHPSDPNIIVVRWGVASEGYLYSRDGGKTFAALCSAAITPLAGMSGDAGVSAITKLSSVAVNSNAATLLDADGHLQVTQLNGLWSDDGMGCTWSRSLVGGWPTSLERDPVSGELLAVVNVSSGQGATLEARSLFLRRSANGTWTSFDAASELVAHTAGQQAYGGELKAVKTATGTRFYATVPVSTTSAPEQTFHIVKSDDGGETWTQGPALPAALTESFSLVAVDPKEPKRLLAASTDDVAADVLYLSEDEGATFAKYAEVRELTGAAFAPDGSVYLTDQGDAADPGGLWTAPALGQPLRKVAGTAGLDCVTWSQAKDAFYLCQGDRVRLFDPASASFASENVVRISEVDGLLSCPNASVGALCQNQLNMGTSWCCTGHYPCTDFCSDYDVTMNAQGQRVFCGKSGLSYDLMAGRTCDMESANTDGGVADAGARVPDAGGLDAGARDAGHTDAGKVTDEPRRKSDDGCAIGVRRPKKEQVGGALTSLGLLLMLLGRNLRKKRPSRK